MLTWSLDRPSLTILFMSNSLGSSGLNSGSNFSSSAIERADRLLWALMRFNAGTLILDVSVNAETAARRAMKKRTLYDCMIDWNVCLNLSGCICIVYTTEAVFCKVAIGRKVRLLVCWLANVRS